MLFYVEAVDTKMIYDLLHKKIYTGFQLIKKCK